MIRVLVVDDDPTAQKVMKHFLERCGYEPMIVSDGVSAVKAASAPDAPPILILDWMMPGLDGLGVCRALRAAKLKHRPYIILFSTRSAKAEIAEGLDAGADDFVPKPFNVAEMQARLRVACRSIEYQRELQNHIDDIEELMRRNELLSEMISHETKAPAPKEPPRPAPASGRSIDALAANPIDFSLNDVRFLVAAAFLEMRLAVESMQTTEHPDTSSPGCYAWGGLVVAEQGAWVDLLLKARTADVTALFHRTLGRKANSEADLTGYFAELARTLANGFSRTIQTRAGTVLQPLISRAYRWETTRGALAVSSENRAYVLSVDGVSVQLVLGVHFGSRLQVAPTRLQALDILAEPFPPLSLSEVPLFKAGAVMTPRFIEKMTYEVEAYPGLERTAIFRPSPLARHFAQPSL